MRLIIPDWPLRLVPGGDQPGGRGQQPLPHAGRKCMSQVGQTLEFELVQGSMLASDCSTSPRHMSISKKENFS